MAQEFLLPLSLYSLSFHFHIFTRMNNDFLGQVRNIVCCPICLDVPEEPVITSCLFCHQCLSTTPNRRCLNCNTAAHQTVQAKPLQTAMEETPALRYLFDVIEVARQADS